MADTCLVHLVHIESSGNQRFIFDTTKRRENVGASELIYQLIPWARAAFKDALPRFDWAGGTIDGGDDAQVVSEAGGSVVVVVRDPEVGRKVVTEVTRLALREAPGLDVAGTVSDAFDWNRSGVDPDGPADSDDPDSLYDPARPDSLGGPAGGRVISKLERVARHVREDIARIRSERPGPSGRFARIPVIAECANSGLPAADLGRDAPTEDPRPLSLTSLAKRRARAAGNVRLAVYAGVTAKQMTTFTDYLGSRAEWVAVIHADGNNLGELFRSLSGAATSTGYAERMRMVSGAVEECTLASFQDALRAANDALPEDLAKEFDGLAPVLPLVLGGDDLTVLCVGAVALPFTAAFLLAFERHTRENQAISQEVPDGLTACAGVAVVKPHFPFSAAYELVEKLTKEAKTTVKAYAPVVDEEEGRRRTNASAFSFHLVHDSIGPDYEHLRAVTTRGSVSLRAQPYVVTAGRVGAKWVRGRHWEDLRRRTSILARAKAAATADADQTPGRGEAGPRGTGSDAGASAGAGAGCQTLPASQLHDLRAALLAGDDEARSRFVQLERRYGGAGLGMLTGLGELFFDVPPPDPDPSGRVPDLPTRMNGLLDAMNAVDLVGKSTGKSTAQDDMSSDRDSHVDRAGASSGLESEVSA